ncbi:FAD dependent oxidoreductase (plasmid) [Arthrobacter sp. Hiyo8]|nr:FAD dependent oxidoreductase [Arthrobacter sp. Hiyo8]
MKLTPYWLDTSEPSGDYRRTPVPENVDVAVIGAGFTGVSAALELAQQEPASPSWSATRSAGEHPAVTEAWPRPDWPSASAPP